MKFAKLKTAKVLKKDQMDKLFGGAIDCSSCSPSCLKGCSPGGKKEIIVL